MNVIILKASFLVIKKKNKWILSNSPSPSLCPMLVLMILRQILNTSKILVFLVHCFNLFKMVLFCIEQDILSVIKILRLYISFVYLIRFHVEKRIEQAVPNACTDNIFSRLNLMDGEFADCSCLASFESFCPLHFGSSQWCYYKESLILNSSSIDIQANKNPQHWCNSCRCW